MELVKKNPRLRKPVGILMELSNDEKARLIFEAQERFRMDTESRIDWANKQGYQQGVKEQEEKDKKEIGRKMKAWGDSPQKIADITGLSSDDIQNL
jgi:hypothetical protein